MDRGPGTNDAALTAPPEAGDGAPVTARPATPRARPTLATALLAGAAALCLSGCGSATALELPPPAGPDVAPPLTRTPAGSTLALGGAPTGVSAGPGAETATVALGGATLTVDRATKRVGEPEPRADAAQHLALRSLPPAARRLVPPGVLPGGAATLRDGSLLAVVRPQARIVEVYDTATGERRSSTPVGVGPTTIACAPLGPCFVVDTQGDALLVVRVGEGGTSVRLSRRVYVAGAPFAIAMDEARRRLWLTLTARNEVVELGAHGRPHILQRLPTARQPDSIAVDEPSGDVLIGGRVSLTLQTIEDPASPDR